MNNMLFWLSAFYGISLLALGIMSGALLKTSLGHRIPFPWTILFLVSIPLWVGFFIVFPGPLYPVLDKFSISETSLYTAIRKVIPVVGTILLGGVVLTTKTPRKRRVIAGVLVLVLAAMPVAITVGSFAVSKIPEKDAIDNLNSNLAIWQERRPAHYSYSFQYSGVLMPYAGPYFQSEVRQGEPTLSSGGIVSTSFASRHSTIDDLFDAMQVAIYSGYYYRVGDYNPDFGFPQEFSWSDVPCCASDSIITIRVFNFKVLP